MKLRFEIEKQKRKIEAKWNKILAVALFVLMLFSEPLADKLLTITELHSVYALAEKQPLAIYYPYTGNSGLTLIHCDCAVILIDCGRSRAQFDIDEFLENTNTQKIDLAILTHPDNDHLNMFVSVAGKIHIEKFITCEYSIQTGSEMIADLESVLNAQGTAIETTHSGDSYIIGNMQINIVFPATVHKNSNNNSIVTRIIYGDFTALFMGDVTASNEKEILASGADVSADVLTVSHHGSANATSEEFIRAAAPKYAVIMTSESRYLPSGQTIARLSDFGCEIYRTDKSGLIAVCSNGEPNGIQIFTDR